MRVHADRSRCVGAGNCVLTTEAVFDQDDEEGLVVVVQPEPPADLREAVTRAVQMGPAGAITLAG